jgi:hypothetical protein
VLENRKVSNEERKERKDKGEIILVHATKLYKANTDAE